MGLVRGYGWAWRAVGVALATACAVALAVAATDVRADGQECPGARIAAKRTNLAETRNALLCEINRVRAEHGLDPLTAQEKLRTAAQRHSTDMVDRHYFSHVSPGGQNSTDRARKAGYIPSKKGWGLGENLAWATRTRATPARTVQMWLASPPHRAVLLAGRYEEAGIGIAAGTPVRRRRAGATVTLMVGWRD